VDANELHYEPALASVGSYINAVKFVGQIADDLCTGGMPAPNANVCRNVKAAGDDLFRKRQVARRAITASSEQAPAFGDPQSVTSDIGAADAYALRASVSTQVEYC
jgi:hypothetical protein